ncbi:MAG: ShlB/FhaC/HecB family hemolysin secretion/activation protein [Candidatus Omnitrophota bacterium]
MNRRILSGFVFFIVLSMSSHAWVLAALDGDQSRESAGVEQSRFEKERAMEEAGRYRAPEDLKKESTIVEALSEPAEGDVTFELKKIVFTGNQEIAAEQLDAVVASYLGRKVTLKNLQEIATQVKKYYRAQGFIAVYVYLPPQNVTAGEVEIAVIEGKLGKIEFQNNKWFSSKTLERAARFSAGKILFFNDLQRAISMLNKHRDIKAKAVLKPGKERETTDVEIDVKDKFPIHFGVDVNNLGTDNTGRTRVGFSLEHTNLLGRMDKASSRFQIGDGVWAVGADYNIPFTPIGTRAGFLFSRSESEVGGALRDLDIEGDATTYGVYLLQPYFVTEKLETSFRIGFDMKQINNYLLGNKAGRDRLRILNLETNAETTDRWGKSYFPQSFHIGFSSFLGGSDKVEPAASRLGTGGQFFIYRGNAIRYQRLPIGMMLGLRSSWQLSNDLLPPSEQFRLGGAFSVRGYPEGDYLADYGGLISSELYVPSYFFPENWKLPYSSKNLRNQIQGTTFIDFGWGELRRPLAGETESRFLAGMGLGVRMHLFDRVYARVQWASPFGNGASNGSDSAFYYGVSAELC